MAQLLDLSEDQIREAVDWTQEHRPNLYEFLLSLPKDKVVLVVEMFFDLRTTPIPLKTTEFVLGVVYKNREDVLSGKERVNLSFYNPHPPGKADVFAKDLLIAQLSKL